MANTIAAMAKISVLFSGQSSLANIFQSNIQSSPDCKILNTKKTSLYLVITLLECASLFSKKLLKNI